MTPADPLEQAVELLLAARRPAILVGPQAAGSIPVLLRLAELLGAALATTPDALSLIDGQRSCGVFSFGASSHAKKTLGQADLVLALSDLTEFTCRLGEAFATHTLIQITDSARCLGRNRDPNLAMFGDIPTNLARLCARLAERRPAARDAWFEPLPSRTRSRYARTSSGTMHPEAAALAIEAALPDRARVCLDVTSAALYCYQQWRLSPQQRAFSSIEQSACMGEATLASLGVRLASGLPTLALVGDWGQCMTPAELHTAVELGLGRYVVVVWANGGGAFIGAGVAQQNLRVPEAAWRWQRPPSFARIARGYGAEGVVVTTPGALRRAVQHGLAAPRPVLIEARVDPLAPVPAGDRFLTLGESRS